MPAELEDSTVLAAKPPYDGLYEAVCAGADPLRRWGHGQCSNALALWNRGVEAMQAAQAAGERKDAQAAGSLRFC